MESEHFSYAEQHSSGWYDGTCLAISPAAEQTKAKHRIGELISDAAMLFHR